MVRWPQVVVAGLLTPRRLREAVSDAGIESEELADVADVSVHGISQLLESENDWPVPPEGLGQLRSGGVRIVEMVHSALNHTLIERAAARLIPHLDGNQKGKAAVRSQAFDLVEQCSSVELPIPPTLRQLLSICLGADEGPGPLDYLTDIQRRVIQDDADRWPAEPRSASNLAKKLSTSGMSVGRARRNPIYEDAVKAIILDRVSHDLDTRLSANEAVSHVSWDDIAGIEVKIAVWARRQDYPFVLPGCTDPNADDYMQFETADELTSYLSETQTIPGELAIDAGMIVDRKTDE